MAESAPDAQEAPLRVDDEGFLLGDDPDGAAWKVEWIGEGVKGAGGRVHYEAAMLDSWKVEVGKPIYATPASCGDPCEIALVTELYETKGGQQKFRPQYFWRHDHIEADATASAFVKTSRKEVLMVPLIQEPQSVNTIER